MGVADVVDGDGVSLKDYFDARFDAVEEKFKASEAAITKAEFNLSKRLDGMNEFREALKDAAARMATRNELELVRITAHSETASLMEKVNALERAKSNLDGRLIVIAGLVSAAIAALIGWFVR